MKTLNKTRKISNYAFFMSTKAGTVQSIILASLPEALATIFLFSSLFSIRGSNTGEWVGIGIGCVVSYVIYFEWAFGMAIKHKAGFSAIGSIFGGLIAFGGWYLAFLQSGEVNLFDGISILDLKFLIASGYVFGNTVLLCFLNHEIYSKTEQMVVDALEEEVYLEKALSGKRKESLKDYLKDLGKPAKSKIKVPLKRSAVEKDILEYLNEN